MKLDEFVSEAITQILKGVELSQSGELGGHVNPWIRAVGDSAPKGKYFTANNSTIVQMVSFDIAVTVEEGLATGAKGRVTVAGMAGAEGNQSVSGSESKISRIRFEVPISLPRTGNET
jgi:hypothetical protein